MKHKIGNIIRNTTKSIFKLFKLIASKSSWNTNTDVIPENTSPTTNTAVLSVTGFSFIFRKPGILNNPVAAISNPITIKNCRIPWNLVWKKESVSILAEKQSANSAIPNKVSIKFLKTLFQN